MQVKDHQQSGYRQRFLVLIKHFFICSQMFYALFKKSYLSSLHVLCAYFFYFPLSLFKDSVSFRCLLIVKFYFKDVVILNTGTPQASFQLPLHSPEVSIR